MTYFFELYRSPKFLSQGLKKIYWMKINGNYKIVASKWINLPINLEASYLSYHSDKIINFFKRMETCMGTKKIMSFMLNFMIKMPNKINLKELNPF